MLPDKYTCDGQMNIFDYLTVEGDLHIPDRQKDKHFLSADASPRLMVDNAIKEVSVGPDMEYGNYLEPGQTIFVNMDHQVTSLVIKGAKGRSFIAEDEKGRTYFVSNKTYNRFWASSRQQAEKLPSVYNK